MKELHVRQTLNNCNSQGCPANDNTFDTDQITNTDIITVSGYDNNGCTDLSNSVQVFVNESPEPVLFSDVENERVCTGESVELTASSVTEYQFFIEGNS